jgi:type II secretory pathway component PulJ
MKSARRTHGFLLFEAMLATAIFAMAIIGLARCVDNCLRAEVMVQDDDRARRALENRMAEIEMGSVKVGDPVTDELKDMFEGMKLRQARTETKLKNEKGEDVNGVDLVTLDITWTTRGDERSRSLQFYVLRRSQ